MSDEKLKARVFISCGQRTKEETHIAQEIKKVLEELEYKAYVAVKQQSLRDLRHNIFKELEDSEYIVFVDFKREALVHPKDNREQSLGEFLEKCQWRGSLFCHQELAVASYLDLGTERDMEILAFHQEGINSQDGMMRALQVNSKEFTDPGCLPELIACHARNQWTTHWQNRLQLKKPIKEKVGPYWHIKVENLHRRKHARDCYGHLKQAYDTCRKKEVDFEHIELKWAYSKVPNVVIFANTSRYLDACRTDDGNKGFYLSTNRDTTKVCEHIIKDPGTYKLKYVVVSDNFPDGEITCELVIDDDGNIKSFT